MTSEPSPGEIADLVQRLTGAAPVAIARFPTGLAHFVYDVTLLHGNTVVARVTRPESRDEFASALFWHPILRERGVPLARILQFDLESRWPIMLLERLPGTDLQHVYLDLTVDERATIASQIADIQRRVRSLPSGGGFGYAASWADPGLHATWTDLIRAEISRSRERIRRAGIVDESHCDQVDRQVNRLARVLDTVPPTPFLDDTTTKNVIIEQGRLTGIVDADRVCFGDPLFALALTRMAITSRDWPDDYVWAWFDSEPRSAHDRALLDLYTAVFACGFLAEFGQTFNRAEPEPVDHVTVHRISALLDELTRF